MRRAKPPFPINLIWNVKAFYVVFIVVMIASLAAVGLAPGMGSTSRSSTAPVVDDSPVPLETPTGVLTFEAPEKTIDASKPHKAILQTNKGTIEIALNTDAPKAVNSFAFLAGAGFYENLAFFYVDRGFVAQAGDPTCDATQEQTCTGGNGPGYKLPLEKTKEGHEKWAVVAPATATGEQVHGSQFRVLFEPDPRLDGKETVFGKVVNEEGRQILSDLQDLVPCSVVQADDCDPDPDMSSALIIESVIVEDA